MILGTEFIFFVSKIKTLLREIEKGQGNVQKYFQAQDCEKSHVKRGAYLKTK